jgi:hypothetical protein
MNGTRGNNSNISVQNANTGGGNFVFDQSTFRKFQINQNISDLEISAPVPYSKEMTCAGRFLTVETTKL